jgi:hypothetical protein
MQQARIICDTCNKDHTVQLLFNAPVYPVSLNDHAQNKILMNFRDKCSSIEFIGLEPLARDATYRCLVA